MAPFYFNQEYWWYTDIASGLMNMLVGVDGVLKALKNKTGLALEKEEGDVSWIYHPPVDALQYMYSILPHELDAAGQKYQDLDMIRKSLNSTFWMNMATCHQIRMHVSLPLLMFCSIILYLYRLSPCLGISKSSIYT